MIELLDASIRGLTAEQLLQAPRSSGLNPSP
jgi:hypothetical protein